ncbi:NTP transferase domain-containing protein [Lysobacter soli]|uniref:sugar phosphate nucleotidyltransferase n=1 Tax=Lysobacter soli TaxID=453783 RepID=UPI0012ED094F|nr:sugar phosphate nucleotidyltransferase [Lysobacter soli]QGW64058.1 NTP transferase domain-containing protein [Lysobacter soli]
MSSEIILLVGGMGTRLRSVVADVPKPLAPIDGRPFLAYVLDAYAATGMQRVILATGYGADQIHSAIGTRWAGMEVAYSHEDRPLGTGGAIRQAAQLVKDDGVHLANGDTFLRYAPDALEANTREHGARMGVALASVADVGRYGAVDVVDGHVRAFREKGGSGSGLINAGSYFITGEGLAKLPPDLNYSFEERVLLPWALDGYVAAFEETHDFIDIGVPEDYARAPHVVVV